MADGPDFSNINTLEKATKLFEKGELEKILLLPAVFGGQEVAENVVFVPVGFAHVKAGVDENIIRPLVAEGKVSRYSATPEYEGDSFIPIAINIEAWDPGSFRTAIAIWGAALEEASEDQS